MVLGLMVILWIQLRDFQSSIDCTAVLHWVCLRSVIGREKNLPPFQPFRCKTKTNCNSATPIFQRLRQLALFHFKFPLVSVTFVRCNGNVIFRTKRIRFDKFWFFSPFFLVPAEYVASVARTRIDRYRLYKRTFRYTTMITDALSA